MGTHHVRSLTELLKSQSSDGAVSFIDIAITSEEKETQAFIVEYSILMIVDGPPTTKIMRASENF